MFPWGYRTTPVFMPSMEAAGIEPAQDSPGSCCVYVFDADHGVKVGVSERGPNARLHDIRQQAGIQVECIYAEWCISAVHARGIEATAHHLLSKRRRGEWFQCHPLEAVEAVKTAAGLVTEGLLSLRRDQCTDTRLALIRAGAWRSHRMIAREFYAPAVSGARERA